MPSLKAEMNHLFFNDMSSLSQSEGSEFEMPFEVGDDDKDDEYVLSDGDADDEDYDEKPRKSRKPPKKVPKKVSKKPSGKLALAVKTSSAASPSAAAGAVKSPDKTVKKSGSGAVKKRSKKKKPLKTKAERRLPGLPLDFKFKELVLRPDAEDGHFYWLVVVTYVTSLFPQLASRCLRSCCLLWSRKKPLIEQMILDSYLYDACPGQDERKEVKKTSSMHV